MNDIDIEKLLEQLPDAREAEGPIEYTDNVVPFLVKYQIKEGDYKVPEKLLYKLYKASTKNPIERIKFIEKITDVLIRLGSKRNWYYMLNITSFELTNALYDKVSKKHDLSGKRTKQLTVMENFFNRNEIKPGTYWLEAKVIYDLFCKPFKNVGKKPGIGYLTFTKYCRFYFKERTSNGYLWFSIAPDIRKHVSEQQFKNIRRRFDEEKERRRRQSKRKSENLKEIEGEV